eukprot:724688-Pelagomonas_calceolata.AAC.6
MHRVTAKRIHRTQSHCKVHPSHTATAQCIHCAQSHCKAHPSHTESLQSAFAVHRVTASASIAHRVTAKRNHCIAHRATA